MKRFPPVDRSGLDAFELHTRSGDKYARWKPVFAGTYQECLADMMTRPATLDFNIRPQEKQWPRALTKTIRRRLLGYAN